MKDEFLSIIMECAASIVNEKNSENSLLRDECGETLYGQVLTQLTNAIANLLSSIWIKEYSEARNNHIINDSTVESRFSHFRKLSTTKKYRKYIFDKYELLENDVDQYINNYYDMIGEIVQSYKKDKADLENHFNFIYGKMIAIHSGMGDTHNGKNVCEVEFENGTLFYKPRACLTDRFFEELLTIVSPQSMENIQFCSGCQECFKTGMYLCSDSMNLIRSDMLASDVIVLVSPVYNNSISGSTKVFLDRISCWTHLFKLAGKYAILVTVSDRKNMNGAMEYLKYISDFLGLYVVDSVVVEKENLIKDEFASICKKSVNKLIRVLTADDELIHVSERQEQCFRSMKKSYKDFQLPTYEKNYWEKHLMRYNSLLDMILSKRLKFNKHL